VEVDEKILIVEDQAPVAQALGLLFDLHELPNVAASDPEQALRIVEREPIGLVLQDMNFSPNRTDGTEGIELFRRLRLHDPDLPVLLVTAWTSLETAVQLVKEGASDYLAKPWDDARLVETARALLEGRRKSKRQEETLRSREEIASEYDLCGLIYASEAMHRVVSLALRVAPADVPVLITGPNGTGKEKIAEVVQANSARRAKPFLKVNAGALPDTLLESELFGAEAGAFTGAKSRRIGRFEAADGGTLLLDEIGNLSDSGQMKLLRVLQSGEFERLGSNETRRVNVRVLCATNADLLAEIEAGSFRKDLYFRLNVIEIRVPPLRDRFDDIVPLAEHFLAQHNEVAGAGAPRSFGEASVQRLLGHDWPGNVRELQNRIQRACLVAEEEEIRPADLDLGSAAVSEGKTDPERRALIEALDRHGGVVSRVAAELGISRQALYRRMERFGVVLERRPRGR